MCDSRGSGEHILERVDAGAADAVEIELYDRLIVMLAGLLVKDCSTSKGLRQHRLIEAISTDAESDNSC